MIVEINTVGSGMDEHETSPRGTGSLTTWHHMENHRESFLIWPFFDRNFNLQMGKSFNFILFYVFFMIQVHPSWSDVDICTCLFIL